MYTAEEIRKSMEPAEPKVDLGFISHKQPDRKAAAQRYFLVDDMLYDWHGKLNDQSMNTRSMPTDLKQMYDDAVHILLKIREYEKSLIG
jgi:hypothetical protein